MDEGSLAKWIIIGLSMFILAVLLYSSVVEKKQAFTIDTSFGYDENNFNIFIPISWSIIYGILFGILTLYTGYQVFKK